jgi:hypothetical protein
MVCALAMTKIRREVAGFEKLEKTKTIALEINGLQQEVGRCFHQGDNYKVGPEEASKSIDIGGRGSQRVKTGFPAPANATVVKISENGTE